MSDQLAEELTKIDLFSEVPHKHLKAVAGIVEVRDVKASDEILREGRYSGEFFVIFAGSAEISVRGKHRWTLGPRDFFGEVAILGHSQSMTVTALDEMRVGAIDAKPFQRLLTAEPSIAVHMIQTLILRLDELTVRPVGQLA